MEEIIADNSKKKPFGQTLPAAMRRSAETEIAKQGLSLPCSVAAVNGSIVTVNFLITGGPPLPQITCPVAGPEWIRYPIQVGDFGFVVPASAYLGEVSGLGGGAAGTWQPANLSALVFFPIGNVNWPAPTDPNALEIYGFPNVIIRDKNSGSVITITPTGITIDLSGGGGNVVVTGGDVTADGVSLKTHVHGGVSTGFGDTGPPV